MNNHTCMICGSRANGIVGSSCRKFYNKATWAVLSNHSEESLTYNYTIKMKAHMGAFVEYYSALVENGADIRKTLGPFFTTFAPSVVTFYKEKGYVSKKQLQTVMQLEYKYGELSRVPVNKVIEEAKSLYLKEFQQKYVSEIIPKARVLYMNDLVSSGKMTQTKEKDLEEFYKKFKY